MIAAAKGTESRTLAKDLIADADVDQEGDEDIAPDRPVVRVDTDSLPLIVNPAPKLESMSVNRKSREGRRRTVASP